MFIVFHILHFTTRNIFPDYSPADVYGNVIRGFSVWWIVLLYVAAMAALGLHLYHGIWSSLRTLGASRSSPNPLRRPAAAAIAVVLWLGFSAIPIAVFAGLAGRRTPNPPAAAPAAATAPPVPAG